MKTIFFIIFIAFISVSFGFHDWTVIVKKAKPAVVSIFTYDEYNDPEGYGSGFILNEKGNIVTCHHVLDGAYSAQVKYENGEYHSVKNVIAEDRENDVIIVSTYGNYWGPYLEIADPLPEPGEWVIVIGSPHELEQTVTEGIISAVRGNSGSEKIQLSAPGAPGQSGSPILNLQGEVLGIVTSYIGDIWENFGFATPAVRIAELHLDEGIDFYDWQVNRTFKGNFVKRMSESSNRCRFALECLKEVLQEYFELSDVFDLRRGVWARTYFKLGQIHQFIGQSKMAISMYEEAITHDKKHLEACSNLGDLYLDDKQYYEARYYFKKALRIRPDDYEIHYKMGITFFESENFRDAIVCFKQAVFYYPSYTKAHYKLGVSYVKVNDKIYALHEYECLMDLDMDLAIELFNLIYEDKIPPGKKQYKNFFEEEKDW